MCAMPMEVKVPKEITAKDLNNVEKAALLLGALGDDAAAIILRSLSPSEIKKVTFQMSKMEEVPTIVVDEVIDEFLALVKTGTGVVSLGAGFVRDLLTKALDTDADEYIKRLGETETEMDLSSLEALSGLDPKMLTDFTKNEHPQTIALILAHIDPDQAAGVLQNLPKNLQVDVITRIANLDRIPPGIIYEIAEALKDEIATLGSVGRKVGGVQPVAEILNRVDKATETSVLSMIEETSPELAEQVRDLMFTFEDLSAIDDRGIQMVLREVSNKELAVALRSAGEEVKNKIFKNLSERAAEMLKEDIDAMGPVRLSDVEKAQQGIVRIASRLSEEGKIALAGRGGEEAFV
ncbi:MAG: flagellar motor switch protein FliG [Deltaproteobacteria bacterium]|nr:flagellar motor switch protein FliG [Deltaproteobacteria bacterium]